MAEILIKKGCKVVAAGAFIGQHSYKDIIPVAIGRPDKNDLKQAFNFGKNSINNSKHLSIEEIPVQPDWISKSKSYFKSVAVECISENCTKCGICAKYCPTGVISAKTGKVIYREKLGVPGAYLASPLLAGGHIYFASYNGRITVVNPDDKLNVVSRCNLKEKVAASPIAADNQLFVRTTETLYAFGK